MAIKKLSKDPSLSIFQPEAVIYSRATAANTSLPAYEEKVESSRQEKV